MDDGSDAGDDTQSRRRNRDRIAAVLPQTAWSSHGGELRLVVD